MKGFLLAGAFCSAALFLWLPARNDAPLFEAAAKRDAVHLLEAPMMPPVTFAEPILEGLFIVYDAVAGFPSQYEVRPQTGAVDRDELRKLGQSGENAVRTPYFRALRSLCVMGLQRLAVFFASAVVLMPLLLFLLLDGWVVRRIRAAEFVSPRPSLWKAIAAFLAAAAFLTAFLPLLPAVPLRVFTLLPIVWGLLGRSLIALWHRFV